MFFEWAGNVQEHPGANRNTNTLYGRHERKEGWDRFCWKGYSSDPQTYQQDTLLID